MHCWCNKVLIGLAMGLVLPIIGGYLLFLFNYHGDLNFIEFLKVMMAFKGIGPLVSVSALLNLLVFFIAINTERLLAARGIVTATLIWAIVVIIFKFVL